VLTSVCSPHHSIPTKVKQMALRLPPPHDRKTLPGECFSIFVAGPGIEPGSGGYEPPEVPLLYPAIILLLLYHLHVVQGGYETNDCLARNLSSTPHSTTLQLFSVALRYTTFAEHASARIHYRTPNSSNTRRYCLIVSSAKRLVSTKSAPLWAI